jgi:rhodanese-related sulfurtransferase
MDAAPSAAIRDQSSTIHRVELRRRLHDSSLTIVDVLPAESYRAGHVPGAVNLPIAALAARAATALPNRAQPIVVYCGSAT